MLSAAVVIGTLRVSSCKILLMDIWIQKKKKESNCEYYEYKFGIKTHKTASHKSQINVIMPPTSEKLRGILVWACPSVCLPVTLGSWETQEPLMLESWNYICGMYMKNKRTRIFFFVQSCRLCMKNLVNRISEEPLRLGSWYFVYSCRPRCRCSD